jgi:transcription initiation factor IIE alpha subunit
MPYTDDSLMLPFSGRSPISRHNSYLAAEAQRSTRGTKKLRIVEYLRSVEMATDQGIAEALYLPLSSVCSLRNALMSDGVVECVGRAMGRYNHPVSLWALRGREARHVDADSAAARR